MKKPLLYVAAWFLTSCLLVGFSQAEAKETSDDRALDRPPVNFQPGDEYADANRFFQGIPGIESAPKGRLWATWYTGGLTEDEHNFVPIVTSGDDGKTWSGFKLVIDPPGNVRAFDPALWTDPTGRLWLFWAQGYSWYDGRAGVWAITTDNPDDENPTWSAPRRLCDGVMMNKPTALKDGTWILPVALWDFLPPSKGLAERGQAFYLGSRNGVNFVASSDQGKSWSFLGQARVPKAQCMEHMVVERKDGRLWTLVRTTYGIGETFSDDGGRTWTLGRPSKMVHPVSRFFIRRLKSGNLLLVKHGPLDKQSGRSHLTAYVSKNDGKNWEGGLLLDERHGVSYPDGFQAADGTIYIIYDFDRTGDKTILMSTFTEEDILARRDVSKKCRFRQLINQATGVHPSQKKKVTKIELDANADGVPFAVAVPAGIRSDSAKIETFEKGSILFTDRKYKIENLPGVLAKKRFLQSSINSVQAECTRSGSVWVVTPSTGRNADSQAEKLVAGGYKKVAVAEFLLFDNIPQNVCSVYQKSVKKGDKIELGKWAVLVF